MSQQKGSRKKQQALLFSSCVLIEGNIYAVTNIGGFPIRISLTDGRMECIDELVKNDLLNTVDIIVDDNEIYVLEQDGNRMMRINTENEDCRYYNISCQKNPWGNYAAYAKYENYIYIFPKCIDHIVKVNLETDSITQESGLYTEVREQYKDMARMEDFEYFSYGKMFEGTMWLFRKGEREVFAYDMRTENWRSYCMPLKVDHCVDVKKEGTLFYILSSEGKIYTWNAEKDEMRLWADCSNEIDNSTFVRLVLTNKRIVVLPSRANDIYLISKENGEKTVYRDYPEGFEYCSSDVWAKYWDCCEDENNYYFAMRSSMFILCINKEEGELKWIEMILPPDEKILGRYVEQEKVLTETEWSLIGFLNYLKAKA